MFCHSEEEQRLEREAEATKTEQESVELQDPPQTQATSFDLPSGSQSAVTPETTTGRSGGPADNLVGHNNKLGVVTPPVGAAETKAVTEKGKSKPRHFFSKNYVVSS